ncbi:Neprosin activation peptide [Arabidopsis thaliana x Arabidopsis arenosa]|uniref:Neprosin activation peptide n=1 Tax=Arabidopsis thaliana x Arabidopsis arenosa TaxID=1240361 RepID=A0A8T2BJG9_9BRAS|nr:Neprosin activation peptide [Arabidopsis thaliana x Arabidopsis arenosa]
MCLIGLLGDVSVTSRRRTTIQNRIKCCLFDHSRRKQQDSRCFHHSSHQVSFKSDTMFSSSFLRLILLLCLLSSSFSSTASSSNSTAADQTLRPQEELQKLKLIRQELDKINKPAVKTIQSPDGDVIACVSTHQQPAFDHPLLQGQRPMDPPEIPEGYSKDDESYEEDSQLWSLSGESCPEGTIPIRRTTEQDMLRASSVSGFGRKIRRVRRDSTNNGHEHAVGYVTGRQYYGAKASINVWSPRVTSQYEFSLSQIWVIAGSFTHDLNTIEAGWQISPELYGDTYPRFFTYWTVNVASNFSIIT